MPLTVDWRELRSALITDQGLNAVIHLEFDCSRTPTLVKAMQRHKVRRDVLHVDFIRVDLDKTAHVEVPIVIAAEPALATSEHVGVAQVLAALPSPPTTPALPSDRNTSVREKTL